MYSENEKQYSRRRSNDEFLRRIQGEEFLSRLNGSNDIPTIARTDIPQTDERPMSNCRGENLGAGSSSVCSMPSLAMVYSPIQEWSDLLSPEEGLARGSIFVDLIKPLEVGGANCPLGGGCRK